MRVLFTAAVAALTFVGHSVEASAQSEYPSRPITLVVPFPAGGVTDVVGRELARGLQNALKQTVVVENRAGAAGVIGTRLVAQAKPDGYTLGILTVSAISIAPHVSANVGYAPLKDFTPISNVVTVAGAIVANADKPYASLAGLVEKAKEQPDRITYASVGPGSIPHLTAEMFSRAAGIKMMHVPYRGASPALQDLLAGHVDLSVETSLVTTVSSLSTGRLKVLAITGPERSPLMPDVPTVAEAGYPGFSAQGWFGFFGPAGLPPKILEVLNRVAKETLQDPEVIARLQKAGMSAAPNSPSEFAGFLETEDRKWAAIAKELNIKLE
ncbi:Bug family tripartite tricarboxylate transporter substrate binding protein [Tardiphaga sp. 367_B4_N1_1]|jgi:tripartite-type tricarboxylate transporter receptor subunit TctC|uniref:Bug family tripartite tricarboxylate transporter substrate binding protein n=1 Tax=unclassified Tardiphaga TaxID=2631404 RepID=UPI003F2417F1